MVFVRPTNGGEAEATNLKHYQSVLRDAMERSRVTFGGRDLSMPLREEDQVASWWDGAHAQIKSLTLPEQQALSAANRQDDVKGNPQRTIKEQALDLMRAFAIIHQKAKTESASDSMMCEFLKKAFKDAVQQLGVVNFKTTKMNALADFVATYPSIATAAFTHRIVTKGFMANGMIGANDKKFPDIKTILNTCTNPNLPKEQEELFYEKFPVLYREYAEQGRLTDSFMEGLGFQSDTDRKGNIVRREGEYISHQRAQVLTHKTQKALRTAASAAATAKKLSELSVLWTKRSMLLEDNAKAEAAALAASSSACHSLRAQAKATSSRSPTFRSATCALPRRAA